MSPVTDLLKRDVFHICRIMRRRIVCRPAASSKSCLGTVSGSVTQWSTCLHHRYSQILPLLGSGFILPCKCIASGSDYPSTPERSSGAILVANNKCFVPVSGVAEYHHSHTIYATIWCQTQARTFKDHKSQPCPINSRLCVYAFVGCN